jgi:hypothetical protein
MKKILLLLAINLIFCSCNSENNRTINIDDKNTSGVSDKELIFYEIENEILVKEIEMFVDSSNNYDYVEKIYSSMYEGERFDTSDFNALNESANKIVQLYVYQHGDIIDYTLCYPLYPPYSSNLPNFYFSIFSKVKDIMVIISSWSMSDIKLPADIMWKYMKDYFPDDYKLYQKNKNGRMALGGGLEWHLTFKKGKLIDKEEVITE